MLYDGIQIDYFCSNLRYCWQEWSVRVGIHINFSTCDIHYYLQKASSSCLVLSWKQPECFTCRFAFYPNINNIILHGTISGHFEWPIVDLFLDSNDEHNFQCLHDTMHLRALIIIDKWQHILPLYTHVCTACMFRLALEIRGVCDALYHFHNIICKLKCYYINFNWCFNIYYTNQFDFLKIEEPKKLFVQ